VKLIPLLALLVGALLAPAITSVATTCRAWQSETVPPPTIRVRLTDHRIVRVPFALYVARVTSSEWNHVPDSLRKAGAVAVKQYGWWKTMHPRRSPAGCFDVHADTRDQIYKHHKVPPAYVWAAVTQTWSWRVMRDGRLAHTGYRTGLRRKCARDVDGYHLKARSGADCARKGWSARQILRSYYDARVR